MKQSPLLLTALVAGSLALFGAGCSKLAPSPANTTSTSIQNQDSRLKAPDYPSDTFSSPLSDIVSVDLTNIEQDVTSSVQAFEYYVRPDPKDGDRALAFLVTKTTKRYQTSYLWFDDVRTYAQDYHTPQLVKTYDAGFHLKQDGENFVVSNCDQEGKNCSQYDVYDYYGRLTTSYSQPNAYDSNEKPTVTTFFPDQKFTIEPTFSNPCTETYGEGGPDGKDATLSGIRIDQKVTKLPAASVHCIADEGMDYSNYYYPQISFKEFDPLYSALTVALPYADDVLIDIVSKKVITKKVFYNSPCSTGPQSEGATSEDLTLTTPSGTTILIKNVFNQYQLNIPENYLQACLRWERNLDDLNPKFNLETSQGEGPNGELGTYQLNLKTRKLEKVK